MLANALLISILLFLFTFSLYTALAYIAHRPQLTILDVQKILRPVEQKRVLQLFDFRVENIAQNLFSRRNFRETQLVHLYETREYLLRMSHNAFVLIVWANTELWRETKFMPGMEDGAKFIELSRDVYCAALNFRVYALMTLLRIHFWMLFRISPWSPFPAPRISSLRETAGFRFYASYQKLKDTVGALCMAHGQEFYDEMMSII